MPVYMFPELLKGVFSQAEKYQPHETKITIN